MIGLAQSVTTPIFLSVKNVTGVVSQRVVTRAEVTTEADEIVNQEMTGQSGMTESQENLERQEVNPQITPTTGDRNRLMLVLEEEIAMIKWFAYNHRYMSAEDHYLDAIEKLDSGDRNSALEHAYKAVKLDPEHVDAWHVISDAHLMADGKPANLIDASKSLSLIHIWRCRRRG